MCLWCPPPQGSKGGKRFEIKKWNAVAMWSWAICTDTCAICRNNLYEPSIEYQANPTGVTGYVGGAARGGAGGGGMFLGRSPSYTTLGRAGCSLWAWELQTHAPCTEQVVSAKHRVPG